MENLNWYPGHMAKTKRMIEDNLKYVDAVVEITDARVPKSSRNPSFNSMLKQKPRLIVMNKYDLADKSCCDEWIKYFNSNNINVVTISCKTGNGINKILSELEKMFADRIEKDRQNGLKRPIKIMIVGIPNVGKSTLINRITKKSVAETGDRPGVTRAKQWVRLKEGIEMLDTPGILPPKFDDNESAKKLAFTGAIKDEIMDIEELACELAVYLRDNYAKGLCERYKIDEDISDMQGYEIVELIGRKRGMLISGGEIDFLRASNVFVDEFREGKLGGITLELPQ